MRKSKRTSSTHDTVNLLRASDRVRDSISDMGSPAYSWKKATRAVKRELLYAVLTTWQGPAIALIWLGIAMLLFAIVF